MNKCFKWKTNDQYATPDNIYNVFINQMGFNDFNPLCEKYDDSLLKTFDCMLVFLSNKTVSGFHKIYFIDRNLKEVKK